LDKLTTASHKLAEAMYKTAGAPGAGETAQGSTPGAESKPQDNVVDAEFVDVDEKKK
jgi:molecular chaperone DnaK